MRRRASSTLFVLLLLLTFIPSAPAEAEDVIPQFGTGFDETVIVDSNDGLADPRDLEFHPPFDRVAGYGRPPRLLKCARRSGVWPGLAKSRRRARLPSAEPPTSRPRPRRLARARLAPTHQDGHVTLGVGLAALGAENVRPRWAPEVVVVAEAHPTRLPAA